MGLEDLCPCHANDGFYMCANGVVYGPCEYEACGGLCVDVDECKAPAGCCGA